MSILDIKNIPTSLNTDLESVSLGRDVSSVIFGYLKRTCIGCNKDYYNRKEPTYNEFINYRNPIFMFTMKKALYTLDICEECGNDMEYTCYTAIFHCKNIDVVVKVLDKQQDGCVVINYRILSIETEMRFI